MNTNHNRISPIKCSVGIASRQTSVSESKKQSQRISTPRRLPPTLHTLLPILFILLSSTFIAHSSPFPEWWSSNNVIRTQSTTITNDYAAANQGQAKWIASRAYNEFDYRLTGGAGTTLSNLVATFTTANNYSPVNHGQLKTIAAPFYDRLSATYPWNNATTTNNHAQANIGQIKHLFSFGGDTDADSLPDYWENYYFPYEPLLVASATDDPDTDGLSNLGEYWAGTDPNNPDTDGDGINDSKELAYGQPPKTSNAFTRLPFIELFETDQPNPVYTGPIHNQNNWLSTPTNFAHVQTNTIYAGTQALSLSPVHPLSRVDSPPTVSHLFASTNNIIWLDLYITAEAAAMPTEETLEGAALMLFNNDGYLQVYDGSQPTGEKWQSLTNSPAQAATNWVRLTTKADFTEQKWLICINGNIAATNLGFASYTENLTSISLKGGNSFSDNIKITTTIPTGIDLDGDGMDDAWEIENFGNTDSDGTGDSDNDGLSDLEEFLHRTNPNNTDSDGDGILDGTETKYGKDPATSNSYQRLPFIELFENDQPNPVYTGQIHDQNQWISAPTNYAAVQTNIVFEGDQSLSLVHPLSRADSPATLSHLFVSTNSIIWLDLYMQVVHGATPTNTITGAGTMLFDWNGHLKAYDGSQPAGQEWITYSNAPAHNRGDWVRLTSKANYTTQKWDIYMDGTNIAQNLGFATYSQNFTAIELQGGNGHSDNIRISLTPPEWFDSDEDGMQDAWEQLIADADPNDDIHDISDVLAEDDYDEDNISNLSEYLRGTSATDPASANVTIYADNTAGNDNYDGLDSTWDGEHGAKQTIAAAIQAAYTGDNISPAPGISQEPPTWNPENKSITITPTGNITIE